MHFFFKCNTKMERSKCVCVMGEWVASNFEIKMEIIQGLKQRVDVLSKCGVRVTVHDSLNEDSLCNALHLVPWVYCRDLSPTPRSMKYYQFLETRAIFSSFLHICILPSLTNDGSVNVWQGKEGKGEQSSSISEDRFHPGHLRLS